MADQQPTTNQPAPAPQAPVQVQQPIQTQYVIQEQSLNGLGGWLAFWMVIFTIGGLGFIVSFFGAIETGAEAPASVLLMVFAPILAIAYLGSTVLIALRKKIARWVSIGAIGLAGLYSIISLIIGTSNSTTGEAPITAIVAGVLTTLVVTGLMALYFVVSKRVQQTLVG